ncbi:MAG: DUF5991 domain-containing protein [Patescibacteria group bacterium]
MNKLVLGSIVIVIVLIVATSGIFAWQYFAKPETNSQNAFNWEGYYQLEQFAPPDEVWEYSLFISSNGGKWKLRLDVDGYQTMVRINATANNIGNSLDVVFDSYNTDSEDIDFMVPKLWKKGDVLFTLTPVQSGIAVEWKKMESNLLKPKPQENIFKKVK